MDSAVLTKSLRWLTPIFWWPPKSRFLHTYISIYLLRFLWSVKERSVHRLYCFTTSEHYVALYKAFLITKYQRGNVEGGRRGMDCSVRIVTFDHRTNNCRRMTQSMMVLRLAMNQRRSPVKQYECIHLSTLNSLAAWDGYLRCLHRRCPVDEFYGVI